MYWLQRPPHLRRIGAVVLVLAAIAWDLRGSATAAFPFAARPIPAGETIGPGDVRWRRLPAGVYEAPAPVGEVAAIDLSPGEPFTTSVLARTPAVPEGWWAVPISVGSHAVPGDPVMLVVTDPFLTVGGLVIASQRGDSYSLDFRPALVAVPGDAAAVVAAADRAGALVTAVRP